MSNKETSTLLFAGGNEGECQYFDPARYKDAKEQLYALTLQGGAYAEYAKKLSTLDEGHRKAVLDALHVLFCPQ